MAAPPTTRPRNGGTAPSGAPGPGRSGRRLVTRLVVGLVLVAVVVVGTVVGVRTWWDGSVTERLDPGCTVGAYRLDTGQAAIASDLVAVVISRGLPARASTLVLTAAIQESKLRNVPSGQGDRDSVGVLQQRPSQGWGTVAQLADPGFAAGAFLDRVVKVPGWESEPAADVIQAVQISIDGTLYAEHEPEGEALARALDGSDPGGLGCTFAAPTKIAAASSVATRLAAALPVRTPVAAGSSVAVPGAGWATTAWAVAHADQYGIDRVQFAKRSWTRHDGWKTDDAAGGDQVVITMAGAATG